jgi:predicted transcriptional regulator
MKVSDIMKKDFLVFEADDTLALAAKKLVEKGQSEAPVVRQRRFIGMFLTSDLAAVFVKKGIFGSPTPADAEKVREDVVSKHIRSKKTWLDPEADILSAFLLLVHRNVDVIPVLDKGRKIMGVVHASDVRKEMAKMLSAGGKLPVRTAEKLQELEMLGGKTAIDHIVHYVQKRGSATAEEVARNCNLTLQEVEEYANSLEKNGLLKLEYSILGKMKLHKPD